MLNNWITDFSKHRKLFDGMSVLILSPIGHPEPRWIECLADMIAFSWHNGLKLFEMGKTERQVVHWARNNLAEEGIKRQLPKWFDASPDGLKYTHLLWLDDDHVFLPNLACKLAVNLQNPDIDMVSALYVNRYNPDEGGDCYCVSYVKDPEREYDETDQRDRFAHYPIVMPPADLIEVDAVGFGACLMKRDVFERVPKPWFTIDWRGGEDITFCKRAKENGVRVFLDGTTKIGHIGTAPVITYDDHVRFMKEHKEEFEKCTKYKFNSEGDNNG